MECDVDAMLKEAGATVGTQAARAIFLMGQLAAALKANAAKDKALAEKDAEIKALKENA